ncbi:hypothetical protein NHX12_011882 [Muraenolepis orangiensis]|uniref:PLD phosphodiesterase domain-containing protein n=1 Tax=Muraenolepis orangiensis TaxID=630683 RepID=A0A9Q0DG05_9TELE|nr:hypothetical protein NHX12_011882 [Muraenolepis orangiensis]
MVLRPCAVVLDRLQQDEENAGKELDEREEMSRKGGKPLSRIPTFQSSLAKKRPTGGSHNAEVPLSKKEPPAELQDGGHVTDGPKSKLPGAPQAQQPLACSLAPRYVPGPVSLTATPFESTRDPDPYRFLSLTPRPVLRSVPRVQELSPEPEDACLAAPPGNTEDDLSALGHTAAPGNTEEEVFPTSKTRDGTAEGHRDGVIPAAEPLDPAQTIDIGDEVPPWESEPLKYALEEEDGAEQHVQDAQPAHDPRPAQDAEKSEDRSGPPPRVRQGPVLRKRSAPPAEVSRSSRSELPKPPAVSQREPAVSQREPAVSQREPAVSQRKPAVSQRKPAVKPSSPSEKRSWCSSFALFCLLPATLLLVGGLGQHVWQYGLPRSTALLLAQLELHHSEGLGLTGQPCSSDCRVRLVESVPAGLYPDGPPAPPSISDGWLRLLARANRSLQVAAFYVTLRAEDTTANHPDPIDAQGRKVFEELTRLQARGVQLQLAVNAPQTSTRDTDQLAATGAEVRALDLQNLTGGIIHTKLWVADRTHLYLGSANMDWRSLSQVKEVGLSVEDCGCLAQDAARIFDLYWSVGAERNASLPPYWPARLSALSSSQQPLHLRLNGVPAQVYLSSAPPQLSARGRTDDLWAILSVIADARQFVHISVMDYLPSSEYTEPVRFWPAVDSALREAACARGVEVRVMVSCWPHSSLAMFVFLQSLQVLHRPPLHCHINVKVFTVPSTAEQLKIPFARVNHAKYMVTDRVAYIGTSNWSENYFTHTAGVGLVVNQTDSAPGPGQTTLQAELDQLFLRDWSSSYAAHLSDNATAAAACPLHHR